MPDTAMNLQLLRFINTDVPFARYCGIEVTELQESGATARLPDEDHLRNHVATQHAGALFTAAESASGACMLGLVGGRFPSITPLVRGATISYLRPGRGPIVATAHSSSSRAAVYGALDEAGRSDFTVHVELRDQTGETVATAEMTWHLRTRSAPASAAAPTRTPPSP